MCLEIILGYGVRSTKDEEPGLFGRGWVFCVNPDLSRATLSGLSNRLNFPDLLSRIKTASGPTLVISAFAVPGPGVGLTVNAFSTTTHNLSIFV